MTSNSASIGQILILFNWTPPPQNHKFFDSLIPLIIEIETQSSHSKCNVTPNGMLLQMECNSKWKVTPNGISLKMECHPKWNVTKGGLLIKM